MQEQPSWWLQGTVQIEEKNKANYDYPNLTPAIQVKPYSISAFFSGIFPCKRPRRQCILAIGTTIHRFQNHNSVNTAFSSGKLKRPYIESPPVYKISWSTDLVTTWMIQWQNIHGPSNTRASLPLTLNNFQIEICFGVVCIFEFFFF